MALVSQTRRQIRQAVVNSAFGEWSLISGETASSASATSIAFSQLAGLLPNSHFARGTIRATVSGTAETKKISAFDGDTCTFTLVGTGFSGSPSTSNIEVLRSGVSFAQVDTALDRAAHALVRYMVVDTSNSTGVVFNQYQTEYTLPSDAFIRIDDEGVLVGWRQMIGDRYAVPWGSVTATEHSIAASTTALAQGTLLGEEMLVNGIILPLRKVGSPDYTLTAKLYSNSSGAPGTLLGSMTAVASTAVSVNRSDVYFSTTTPIRTTPQTVYHVALFPTSGTTLNSTNYYAWQADTSGAAVGGNPSTSSNSGATFSATTGYTRGFRLIDAREQDWRYLHDSDWWVGGGETRTIIVKPDCLPPGGGPWPVRLVGQRKAASIDGSSNDGTTYEGDPEILTRLTVAYLQMDMAMAANNSQMFAMAKKQEMDALELARRNMPRLRGKQVEAL